MAGSKKGERRGGAKPGRQKTGGRQKGVTNRPKFDPVAGLNPAAHRSRLQLEDEQQMYFLATGTSQRLPRDVMLDAMRYFENTANEYMKVFEANMAAELEALKTGDQIAIERAARGVVYAENRLREYILMAVEVGYKVAPYVHARLSAIAVADTSQNPLNMIRQLLQDIDEAGKVGRYIDHDPTETAPAA